MIQTLKKILSELPEREPVGEREREPEAKPEGGPEGQNGNEEVSHNIIKLKINKQKIWTGCYNGGRGN